MNQLILYLIPAAGLLALLFAFWRAQWIESQDYGTERMNELSGHIREGAQAFLSKEYSVLSGFVVVVAALLAWVYYVAGGMGELSAGHMSMVAVAFIVGALCSGAAGYFGMRVATKANVRTTNAAREGLAPGLEVSFAGGTVMGMSVVGLAVFGLGLLALIFGQILPAVDLTQSIGSGAGATSAKSFKGFLTILTGFSMGASSIALFARVGGGIYTKAADVGGDLFGKVEYELPEDDPRNPASIADAVGDNVGDVAGMGADLFESYIGSIIGAMVLALPWAGAMANNNAVFLPLIIAAVGIVISIACTFLVSVDEDGDPSTALHKGTITAAVATAIAAYFLVTWAFPAGGVTIESTVTGKSVSFGQLGPFVAMVGGLIAGVLIGLVTEYYTSDHYTPVREISEESEMGTAPNIIAGVSLGMWSAGIPVLLIVCSIGLSYWAAGLYGIGLAAVGMLSTTGIQLAVDAFGPIADNAGGIAEMAELPDEVRDRTDTLDSVGNTTAAIGKGFAIGSAALTSLALFTAYAQQAGLTKIDILQPRVVVGIFVGAATTFVFSALTMEAVGRSASTMIEELRRQFREIDGIQTGDATPEYKECISISTEAALREMIAPGLLAIGVVVLAGYVFGPPGIANVLGPQMLGGILAGVTTSGVAMAIFMSNAGGAWDNAKKYIEAGHHGGDGSEAHKASVVGDTVGDPFKDTAGPSLNILLKLMSVTALVLAPIIAVGGGTKAKSASADRPAAAETAQVDGAATGEETSDDQKDEG
ncbi:MAG: sodium-translocating pyrophosphatase [Bradymonadaceae bacterium]